MTEPNHDRLLGRAIDEDTREIQRLLDFAEALQSAHFEVLLLVETWGEVKMVEILASVVSSRNIELSNNLSYLAEKYES